MIILLENLGFNFDLLVQNRYLKKTKKVVLRGRK